MKTSIIKTTPSLATAVPASDVRAPLLSPKLDPNVLCRKHRTVQVTFICVLHRYVVNNRTCSVLLKGMW